MDPSGAHSPASRYTCYFCSARWTPRVSCGFSMHSTLWGQRVLLYLAACSKSLTAGPRRPGPLLSLPPRPEKQLSLSASSLEPLSVSDTLQGSSAILIPPSALAPIQELLFWACLLFPSPHASLRLHSEHTESKETPCAPTWARQGQTFRLI